MSVLPASFSFPEAVKTTSLLVVLTASGKGTEYYHSIPSPTTRKRVGQRAAILSRGLNIDFVSMLARIKLAIFYLLLKYFSLPLVQPKG